MEPNRQPYEIPRYSEFPKSFRPNHIERLTQLRRSLLATIADEFGSSYLNQAEPANEAANQLKALLSSLKSAEASIHGLGLMARTNLMRAQNSLNPLTRIQIDLQFGGNLDLEKTIKDLSALIQVSALASEEAEEKRTRPKPGIKPNIAQHIFFDGVVSVCEEALPMQKKNTPAAEGTDAYGEFIDILRIIVQGIPGVENKSGEALRQEYLKAHQRCSNSKGNET